MFSKKASLEISIQAIVIVVLAMTLLGLGLGRRLRCLLLAPHLGERAGIMDRRTDERRSHRQGGADHESADKAHGFLLRKRQAGTHSQRAYKNNAVFPTKVNAIVMVSVETYGGVIETVSHPQVSRRV